MLARMRTELERGSVFASYVVETQQPDACGFAVYAGRHREFDQQVTLRIGRLPGESAVGRSLHLLDHHGVERVLDQGVTADGFAFTVTERVDGEPVCTYCDARATDIKGRVGLFLQAVEALEYAHRHFQPHRNLVADLVLVDKTGHIKICGFGLGAAAGAEPEALGHDVQCLGALGARLLAGADAPGDAAMSNWVARQRAEMQQEIARLRSTGVSALLRDLRGDLDAVVDHMRGSGGAEQYAGVDLAAADLARVLQGRSTRVYRRTRWERLRLWIRFQPAIAVAVAVLLLTASAASAVFMWQTVELNRQRRASEARLGELVTLTGALETRLYAAAGSMPAPVPVRAALVRQTRKTLDAATADATLSPELAASVAQQYRALALRSAEAGDAPAQQAALKRAVAAEHATH